jgi:histidine triad (HIT) family protein
MSCLFCDIVKGDIPSTKVYEDDLILAFRDIDPKAPEHIVIVPKEHIASANEINADNSKVIAHIFETVPTITKELGVSERGYRIVNNCGEEGGQTVGHIHFHLLGGRNLGWPPG